MRKLNALINKNLDGSAMLWALCAVSVFMVIAAGIMALSLNGYNKTAQSISRDQAMLDCRSAIGIASDDICKNGESSDFFPEGEELSAKFDFDGSECMLTVKKNGDGRLKLSAKTSFEEDAQLFGILISEGSAWSFSGFVSE